MSEPSSSTSINQITGSSPPEPPKLTDFKVYNPSSGPPVVLPTLPDNYFTPTATDIQAAQSQLAARTQSLVNAPLQIRTAREAETKAKRDRWPETKIRVKFTDGTQLEKVFQSTDKIKAIYAFVRGCLKDDVKPIKFVLYQPPKRDLKVSDLKVRGLTLSELQLAPSSILLLRFEDEALNHVNIPAPLDPSILATAVDLPVPLPPVNVTESSKKTSSTSQGSSSTKSGEVKVPKWLKLGKK